MTLKYDYKDMPDPAGAERLLQHGAKVTFKKDSEEEPVEVTKQDDLQPNNKPKMKKKPIWLVGIQIPRRFIDELDDSDLEIHNDDQDVDVEDVSDARDDNIEDGDALVDNDSEQTSESDDADQGGL